MYFRSETMKNFLSVPPYSTDDHYDLARFRLTWNVNVFLAFVLITLVTLTFYTQSEYVFIYGAALLANFTALVYMYYFRNYKLLALVLSALLYSLILISQFTVDGYVHYLEPFWSMVIVLYIYFIRGKILGGIALGINIVATSLYFIFRLDNSLKLLHGIPDERLYSMAFEFSICLILLGYLIHQFIDANVRAETAQRQLNDALLIEKKLVDKQNSEKTVLLQEIHHRVKNNLQIVTSLLRMQSEKIRSEETKSHFQDAINRVLTMSLIHQKLYENEDLADINLSEYVDSLCNDILQMNAGNRGIQQQLEIECEHIGSKTLVPLGLIITELISNSVKHAFSTFEGVPMITISIKMTSDSKRLSMKYSDNGKWKENSDSTFGIQLIETFTEQLEGSVKRAQREDGTHYSFEFKNLDLR